MLTDFYIKFRQYVDRILKKSFFVPKKLANFATIKDSINGNNR